MFAVSARLPILPKSYIDQLELIATQEDRLIKVRSGNRSFAIPDEIEKWLQTHVVNGVWGLLHYHSSNTAKPHVDGIGQKLKLNFLIDTDGENTITTWHRGEQIVETHKFSKYSWTFLQVDVAHRVRGFANVGKRLILGIVLTQTEHEYLNGQFRYHSSICFPTIPVWLVREFIRQKTNRLQTWLEKSVASLPWQCTKGFEFESILPGKETHILLYILSSEKSLEITYTDGETATLSPYIWYVTRLDNIESTTFGQPGVTVVCSKFMSPEIGTIEEYMTITNTVAPSFVRS